MLEPRPTSNPLRSGIWIGDVDANHTILLGSLPKEDDGILIRAGVFCLEAKHSPSTRDTWTFQLGTQDGPTFLLLHQFHFPNGIPAGTIRDEISRPARLAPGQILVLKLVKSGDPDDLVGLSFAVEYGLVGAKR